MNSPEEAADHAVDLAFQAFGLPAEHGAIENRVAACQVQALAAIAVAVDRLATAVRSLRPPGSDHSGDQTSG